MRRRSAIVGVAALLTVVTVSGVVTSRNRRSAVSRNQFSMIETGMSREEIEAIIGGPANAFRVEGRVYFDGLADYTPDRWEGGAGTIEVFFDDAGRVDNKLFIEPDQYSDPTVFERMRAWLWH